ncbi:ribose-5-phosphate isomerase RpiA [Devosia sp. 63-57]|uniref:ribose-5-phosphate isomerase RpiA n=1 Tax=Devosia sp. 63-57 TaxID=1895751 RepID=UPI00086F5F5F|nr:ribose-5-phosphate isomerase RpiA [Devosia sp. 63-57]ODT48372.1 MAG: ribose 5-phosphate isomerase A [Pelagibacterium sp. SCN 63-126]ODU87022.1 MAG: ribose 5-phosphate isomerase A [Pelagibacterium sp. SCN 63-17]OJX43688.1 MAG: ribose 5-phosphate isomerase A [Devosia sp. 63-57]
MSEALKREAAAQALTEVRSGMRLGLGTGSTAKHFVELLGEKVAYGLDVICVPTSEVTAAQARSLDIPLSDLETLDRLDLTVDGADELDAALNLIKGGGGALLREKIVAAASDAMIVIADGTKLVETLGRFPLPIEVNRFGLGATRRTIAEVLLAHGAEGGLKLRGEDKGTPFVTDGGHLILDAFFGRISRPEALSMDLLNIPGVVQHGLFLNMCSKAYVATPDGVKRLLKNN